MKKTVSVFILMILLMSVLTGCGVTKNSDSQTTNYCFEQSINNDVVVFSIMENNQAIAKIYRYEHEALSSKNVVEDKRFSIQPILQELGIFDFSIPSQEYDYFTLSSGKYSDWILSFGTKEVETSYYYYIVNSYLYELRFESSYTNEEYQNKLLSYLSGTVLEELN